LKRSVWGNCYMNFGPGGIFEWRMSCTAERRVPVRNVACQLKVAATGDMPSDIVDTPTGRRARSDVIAVTDAIRTQSGIVEHECPTSNDLGVADTYRRLKRIRGG
jgi:hypothetical protein